VAYNLLLSKEVQIHLVFHISMLKKKIKDHAVVTSPIPLTNGQGKIKVQPIAILDRRIMKKRDKAVIVGLIK
jgi:hypothetical protein